MCHWKTFFWYVLAYQETFYNLGLPWPCSSWYQASKRLFLTELWHHICFLSTFLLDWTQAIYIVDFYFLNINRNVFKYSYASPDIDFPIRSQSSVMLYTFLDKVRCFVFHAFLLVCILHVLPCQYITTTTTSMLLFILSWSTPYKLLPLPLSHNTSGNVIYCYLISGVCVVSILYGSILVQTSVVWLVNHPDRVNNQLII